MEKNSVDNVSIVFVAFKNFEEKMKDPNFEYNCQGKCINCVDKEELKHLLVLPNHYEFNVLNEI